MCRGVKQPQKGEDIGCLGHWPPWGWPDSHMDTVATVRELELHSTGCGFLRLTEPLSRLSVQLVSQTPKLSRLKAIFSQRPAGRQLGGKPAVCFPACSFSRSSTRGPWSIWSAGIATQATRVRSL